MAFEFGDSQFRDVSSSGIPDRYVDKKKGHFNRIYIRGTKILFDRNHRVCLMTIFPFLSQ